MTQEQYDEALETLSTLIIALGAGLATWGVVNLLEAYEEQERMEKTAAWYKEQLAGLDERMGELSDRNAAGEIDERIFNGLYRSYGMELDTLNDALILYNTETKARKKEGLQQFIHGAALAQLAPHIRRIEHLTAVIGGMAQE
jgi:hypothetical protein